MTVFCASVLLYVVSGQAQTGYISVKGGVVNELGSLQPGVQVVFSSSADPRKMVQYDIAASGTFEVSLVPSINYNLRIMAYVYPLQYYDPAMPNVNTDGPPAAQLNFSADDSLVIHLTQTPRQISGIYGFIKGMVPDSAMRPLRQATVMVLMPGKDVVAEAFTDTMGSFLCRVPAQPQFVSAFFYPYPVQFWSINGTTLSPNGQCLVQVVPNDTAYLNIVLRINPQDSAGTGTGPVVVTPMGSISGRVQTQTTGQPVAGATVIALRVDSAAAFLNDSGFNPQFIYSPYTDTAKSDGSYSIKIVPAGKYLVFARGQNFITQFYLNADVASKAKTLFVDSTSLTGIDFFVRSGGMIAGDFTSLSANAYVNDSNQLWITCNAPQALALDTIVLFSKDRSGDLARVNTFVNSPRQTTFSWQEKRPWLPSFFSYVFVGTGPSDTERSNITGYDPFGNRKISPDSLRINVFSDRWGVRVDWRADTTSPITNGDTTVLYRKYGAEDWKSMCTNWGSNTELWDNSWDKTKDAGKTVSYKVEMSRAGVVTRRSPIVSFTATQEFFSRFGNNLAVGQNETYKTIQQAVDAAQNYDNINVDAGAYAENVDCKGKILSIRGNWNNGVVPVIDGLGGVAITVPYPSISQGSDNVFINGFKIRNALVGVKSSANININQCLFVNIVQKAVTGVVDSAAMAKAAATDPFVDFRLQQNIWQCTFIGQNLSGVALNGVSQNQTDTSGLSGARIVPAISISVNNSLFAFYSMPVFPATVQGLQSSMNFANCDVWQTSQLFGSTQMTVSGGIFTTNPQFIDSINYFLPDNSPLRTMSSNQTTIGYDQQRFWSSGQVQLPPLPTVAGVKSVVTGPHAITVTWNKLAAVENVDAYTVYRVLGYDSLFFVNAQSQWEPIKSNDSLYAIMDSFVTKDSVLVDSSVVVGVPYIYVVIATKSDGSRSDVKLTYPPALSAYSVKIDAPSASAIRNLSHREAGFTMITLQWNRPLVVKSARPVYSVCRIHGGSALSAAGNDSASVRGIMQSLKSTAISVDTFSTTDTVFIDRTAQMDTVYLYVVTVADSAKPMAQRPLAWTAAKIDETVFKPAMPFHAATDQWNMVGPWARGSLTFSAPSSAIIYQWDDSKAEDKLMSSYAAAAEMKSGTGYWFKSGTDTVINVTDTMFKQLMVNRDSMAINLVKGRSGWNQIASVFPFPVRPMWLGGNGFSAYEWVADSARYQEATMLMPWKAYWLNCDKDTQLVVKASDVAINSTGNVLAKKMQLAAWELKVSYLGSGGDPDNYIGVVPAASPKTVRLESPKPPQAFDFPQVYLVQTNTALSGPAAAMQKLAKLYKSSSAIPAKKLEWMVGMSASPKAGTIRVIGCEAVPQKVFVYWVTSSAVIDLKSVRDISVPAHTGQRFGYIVATANPKDIALYTNHFEFHKTYPNPFGKAASIEFSVPYAWNPDGSKMDGETRDVSLSIYNLSGQQVATVHSGPTAVGEHRVVWNGKSGSGGAIATGLYIARLISGDFQKTMTMMKVK